MRLLQLNPNGNEQSALDFHPMVTVVAGLSPAGHARLVEAINALPRGANPGCNGLVEAHGILLDLSVATLDILGLNADIDVVISPMDIPGATSVTGTGVGAASDPLGTGFTSGLPASIQPLNLDDFLAATPRGMYPELDLAKDRVDQAVEAVLLLSEAVERAREAHAEVADRVQSLERQLDAATMVVAPPDLQLVPDTEPETYASDDDDSGAVPFGSDEPATFGDDAAPAEAFAGVGLMSGATPDSSFTFGGPDDDAADALANLVDDSGSSFEVAETVLNPYQERLTLEQRFAELTAIIDRVDRGITELAAVDPRPIQVLVDAIHNPGPVEFVPSRRGNELADNFVRLQGEVGVLEEGLRARGMDTPSAMARLDESKRQLAKAEKAMRPPEYTEQDRIDLEAAHDLVLAAQEGGRRGKKNMEAALAKEQTILDRMGFPTWSAYVMGSGLMTIDPAAEHRLEAARNEFEEAEQHWSNVTAMIEADPVHRELLDRLEALYLEAFDLLGGDDETEDLESKLRNLLEEKREITTEELLEALLYQLEIVGIALPPEMADIDRAIMVSEAFLEEAKAIIHRLNELGAEKVDALTELELVENRLDDLPTEDQWHAIEEARRIEAEELTAAAFAAEDAARAEAGELAPADEVGWDADASDTDGGVPAAEHLEQVLLSDEELEALEHEYEVAREDEAEYLELVEAREALLEAAMQVDETASATIRELGARYAAADARALEAAAPVQPAHAGSDLAFADVGGVNASSEAVEFFLLARLAALRTASYAGSVPLLIDDALVGQPRSSVEQVLQKLERMAESVQIIYLSDDETVTGWAEAVGFDRAALVRAPASFT